MLPLFLMILQWRDTCLTWCADSDKCSKWIPIRHYFLRRHWYQTISLPQNLIFSEQAHWYMIQYRLWYPCHHCCDFPSPIPFQSERWSKPMSVHSSPLLDGTALKQLVLHCQLLIHLTTFIFLKLLFIMLTVICLWTLLPCSFSSSSTLPKATFTIIFIIWQTLANMSAQNIVAHGFSSKWSILLAKTRKLAPGYTDVVSTVMSSFLDSSWYFFGWSCSPFYHFSFITFLMLIALTGLAPSSINVESMQQFKPSTVEITNFSVFGGGDGVLDNLIIWTQLVVEHELRENTTFKFTTQEHVIVGWPNIEVGQLSGDIKFPSDVLLYNMTCWWEAPSFNMSQWNMTWYTGGFAWYPFEPPPANTTSEFA